MVRFLEKDVLIMRINNEIPEIRNPDQMRESLF